ncbi:hypothetical protein LAD64_23605 [Klebsiella pneumoniae]|nr:hypothetical protein [Klebsiella pneumoniae]
MIFRTTAFRTFRKVMPRLSRTEKAIDAGTPGGIGDLFRGQILTGKVHNLSASRGDAGRASFSSNGPVEEACRMANDFAITPKWADFAAEAVGYLKEQPASSANDHLER